MRPILPTLIFLTLIPACGSQQTVAPQEGPVTTSVSATPAAFMRGQTTTIAVSVTNHGTAAVDLAFSSGCQLAFDIRSASGTRLGPGGYACTMNPTVLHLEPGETSTRTWTWRGEIVLGDLNTTLPPGDYSVVGGYEGIGHGVLNPSTPVPVKLRGPIR